MPVEICPVPTPKLISCKSTVELCGSCGAWIRREPTWMMSDLGGECPREGCGGTSVRHREGRPFGKKSRHWELITSWWEEMWHDLPPDREILESVTTVPPLKDVDWAAVESWYRSRNIYRLYAGFGGLFQMRANDDPDANLAEGRYQTFDSAQAFIDALPGEE